MLWGGKLELCTGEFTGELLCSGELDLLCVFALGESCSGEAN
ncbi:MAG TPA: hypothetical protein P5543_11350 [Planctomycetota bacterium]|nr:hypothetical protein [Planctomycetota bacterium]